MKISHVIAKGAGNIAAAAAVFALSLAPFAAFADGPSVSSASSAHSAGGISGSTGGHNSGGSSVSAAPAHLTVITKVISVDNLGATPSDWTMVVTNTATHAIVNTFPGSDKGVTFVLKPGTYDVTEKGGPKDIVPSVSATGCLVTLSPAENHTCTFVNTVGAQGQGGNGTTGPVAQDISVTTQMSTPVGVHLTALAVVNGPLAYHVTAPKYGVLSGTAPDLVYLPNPGFSGTDSFNYSVTDGKPATSNATIATVTITVNPAQHGHGHGTTGQVLGAATSTVDAVCAPTITKYLRPGADNDVDQVKALQTLLNKDLGSTISISGIYDAPTTAAVMAFQSKHAAEVLAPWGITAPTGIAYITTLAELKKIDCPTAAESDVLPPLVVWTAAQGN